MKLSRVRLARYVETESRETFLAPAYDLELVPELRAVRIRNLASGVELYADQAGALWWPAPAAVETPEAVNDVATPEPAGGSAEAAGRRRKR